MILSRTKRNHFYMPHSRKKAYFDAIASGNSGAIDALEEQNRGYPAAMISRCSSEEEAASKMRYESVTAANEMCLVAVQAGLLDMVAYDIRDEHIAALDEAAGPAECYGLVHEAAREFAHRMSFVIKEKNYSPRLLRMMDYIKEHLGERIELADIANHVNISRTYASAVFKEELGVNISEYILKERLAEAERLLRETDISIGDISKRLAFCSQSYFTKRFNETEGMTPLEYRRKRGQIIG